MITPDQIAKSGKEADIQKALFCWCALPDIQNRYPELNWLHHIPNGGRRDGITASNMKAEGVKSGVWDLFLPVPAMMADSGDKRWCGIYIEMKRPSEKSKARGGLSENQIKFHKFVSDNYATYVCYSWREAAQCLTYYLRGEVDGGLT